MPEIRDIRKSLGSLETLKSIDLTVERGGVAEVIGPSGSGKPTLLRRMNFWENAGGGTTVFDKDRFNLSHISKREIARLRKKTAFVFQNYNLFRNKTAPENVTEGLVTARKIPKTPAEETASLREAIGRALTGLAEDGTLTEPFLRYFRTDIFQARRPVQTYFQEV